MKYLILILFFPIITYSQSPPKPYRHTMYTIVEFAVDPWNNNYATVTAFRIIQDTLMDVSYKEGTKTITEKKKVRDSFYWIFIYDSVRNEKGVPRFDTLGKPEMGWLPVPVRKEYVIRDYNINLEARFPRKKEK
jgi:hypothetical protein